MDFRELSYVLALAKHQNVTRAAESLYLSQPTLTKFLQNLERDMDQKLFRKLGNKLQLTYAGEVYVAKAREILLLKEELDREMNDIIGSNIGVLKVAFPVMRGTYMLPCTLPIFRSLYPKVKLKIVESDSAHLEGMILNGDTDLAFFNLPIKDPNIDYEVVNHEEIVLILSKDHPLAQHGQQREEFKYPWLDLNLAAEEDFILQTPSQRTRQIVDDVFHQYNIIPRICLETRNIHASVMLAASGYGLSFVCETHLRHIGQPESLVCFSVGITNTTVDFVAAYRKNSYLPYHAQEYIKIVKYFT